MPLIVIEGLDGAGKSTQIDLLEGLIASHGKVCRRIHYPRFDGSVYGPLIARFLRGELGGVETVDPYLVALLFAGDRADNAESLRRSLQSGEFVLADRYVDSNVAYQCAKLGDDGARRALKEWIYNLEYEYNGIPRPDATLFLDVPFRFTVASLSKGRTGSDRDYLNGADDIHESSLDLQRNVRSIYLDIARNERSLTIIDCADAEGEMAAPQEIFSKIALAVSHLI